ncbi:MAG: hypothetical protein J0M04_01615 [Verrucomicrobia bacterium]|nr:hypothetical protein [Verrucomicrobiota bacterium]
MIRNYLFLLLAASCVSIACKKQAGQEEGAGIGKRLARSGNCVERDASDRSPTTRSLSGIIGRSVGLPLEDLFENGFGELRREVARDPDSALAWLENTSQRKLSPAEAQIRVEIISVLATRDGMEKTLAEQVALRGSLSEINVFWGCLAQRNAQLALSLLREAKLSPDQKASAIGNIANTMSDSEPAAALALLDEAQRPETTAHYLCSIFSKWLRQDPTQASIALGALSPGQMNSLMKYQRFLYALSEQDVSVAAKCLSVVGLTKENAGACEVIISKMAQKDLGAALAALSGIQGGPARDSITAAMFASAYSQDPQMAVNEAQKLPPEQASLAYRGIARKAAEQLPLEEALRLIDGVSSPAKQDLYREIARTVAYQNPENAVKVLGDAALSQKIGLDFRQEMVNATVATWAKQDLSAARDWVEKLPEADAAKGCQGLMTSWMKTDPVAASEWLSKQAVGPARDAGAKVLIEQIKDTDPERADQWRKSLTPPAAK